MSPSPSPSLSQKLNVVSAAVSPSPRQSIDLEAALSSALRIWLAARDTLLIEFAGGSDPDDILAEIALDGTVSASVSGAAAIMNSARSQALTFASQLSELQGRKKTGTQPIIAASIDRLLATEEPRFLLRLPDNPDVF